MKTKAQRQSYEKAGRRAEVLATWSLRFKGYRILARRYKTKQGEIDIVATRGKVIAIVEVKQRATLDAAQGSVGYENEERIMNAAEIFLTRHRDIQGENYDLRFDIVYIIGRWQIIHIKNAFQGY